MALFTASIVSSAVELIAICLLALEMKVFTAERTALLRRRRRSETRIIFKADLVLANMPPPVNGKSTAKAMPVWRAEVITRTLFSQRIYNILAILSTLAVPSADSSAGFSKFSVRGIDKADGVKYSERVLSMLATHAQSIVSLWPDIAYNRDIARKALEV